MIPTRRLFFLGAAALVAAPSLVRASSLMPVSVWDRQPRYYGDGIRSDLPHLQWLLDRAKPGEAIRLKPAATYYIGDSIKVAKSNTILHAEGSEINLALFPENMRAPVFTILNQEADSCDISFGTINFGNRRGVLFG